MNELQLIGGCRKGERRAQKELYDVHSRKIMGVCLRYVNDRETARDLLQDGFVKIFTSMDSYTGSGSFEGRVRRILANCALEYLRRSGVLHEVADLDNTVELIQPDSSAISDMSAAELMNLVRELPVGFRTAFNMFAIEGYSRKEISEMLNITESTSCSQYTRVKQLLQCRINALYRDRVNKKERDIWDDAIWSKLGDFEMDMLPGDWEATADRLSGKAPVPLRRTLRYWVVAIVIPLLVVSGSIYLYDREVEDLPITQGIQSSQESTSVNTPAVSIEKTMEQAPVLVIIPAAVVAKAKAAFGAVKVEDKARMAAFRQNVESVGDRPISESEVMSADRSVNEEDTVEPGVERNNDEIVVLKNDVFVADITPVTKKKPEKTASRKWGFGMGGGGPSMGADSPAPQYVTNSSVLKSENLMSLNLFNAEKKDPTKTDIHHRTPTRVGISISRYLSNRFSLQTGLTYSYLRPEQSANSTYYIENDQRLHFIGIPLSLTYKIAEWNRFMFYIPAGDMAEVNVAGKCRMKLFSDEVEIAK